jgi:AcrR family transcriptional regulator
MTGNVANEPTRERLLTMAGRLLAESGSDGVPVWAVNTAAGTDAATVRYRFGFRDALAVALLEERLVPVWRDVPGGAGDRRQQRWMLAFRLPLLQIPGNPMADAPNIPQASVGAPGSFVTAGLDAR